MRPGAVRSAPRSRRFRSDSAATVRSAPRSTTCCARASIHACTACGATKCGAFHDGGPLLVHVLSPEGGYRQLRIGIDAQAGETLQAVIPHGSWFGAELGPGAPFALVGCTVAPGFEYEDFELGDRETLLARHPEHRELVLRFT